MLFSSLIFIFLFLPLSLIIYPLVPKKLRNLYLLVASLIFFSWGGVGNLIIFLSSILLNYFTGLLINKNKDSEKSKKAFLVVGIIANLSLLVFYKYSLFFVQNLNILIEGAGFPGIEEPKVILPIGISFYTFHGLSYIIDLYRGITPVQKKLKDLGLYIAFFPQLIAGPIVRYKDIADQLETREVTTSYQREGVYRFILGLCKKVLIANNLAALADAAFNSPVEYLQGPQAWLGIICYTFQIYFDFSGYSDMAIGIALLFGFRFKENFNFPYLANSIKDFWRRWHISLSSWFRDYLYIPLGGNKKGTISTYRNLLIVFFVTGFWHGASWNFVAWGLFFGAFLILERLGFEKILEKTPSPLRIIYSFLIVLFAWVLFRANDLTHALNYYSAMIGSNGWDFTYSGTTYFTLEKKIALLIAVAGSFGLFKKITEPLSATNNGFRLIYEAGKVTCYTTGLFLCTVYLISGTYNPFIYFRF